MISDLEKKYLEQKESSDLSQATFDVWLDKKRQIIRQRMHREPNLADFRRLIEETDVCVRRLRDPSAIRILVDGEWHGRMKRPIRQLAVDTLKNKGIERMAVVTPNRIVRLVVRFLHTATGTDYMRVFRDEDEALEWLLS